MRVLEVHEPPVGGVAEHVRLLALRLSRAGVHVEVAGRADSAIRARLADAEVRVHSLRPLVGDMLAGRSDVQAFRRLAAIVARGRFDLVHAHGLKAGLLMRLIGPPARVPVVYTPHSLVHRHHLAHSGRKSSQYHKTLVMERVLGRVTATMITVSEQERATAIEDRLISPAKAVTIYNGIEIDESIAADPELAAFRGDGPLLGYVGGLRPDKGIGVLLDGLERAAANGGAPRFAIVGDGPLTGHVRERAARAPLAGTTVVVPFGGRMEPYLRAIDAYVLASPWEGLPLAILEAMMLGVPAIATAVGGVPEAVRDDVTGMLVPPNDPAALATAVQRFAADRELAARLGAAAKRDASERFNAELMVDKTLAVYERCLA